MIFALVVLPAICGVVIPGVARGVGMVRAGRAVAKEPRQACWPATSIPADVWATLSEEDRAFFQHRSIRWNVVQGAKKRVIVGPLMVSEKDVQERLSPEGRRIYTHCVETQCENT